MGPSSRPRCPARSDRLRASQVDSRTTIDASLQAVLDCVALPVWVVDHGGRVVLANPAALDVFGYELAELQGRHGHDTVHYKHPDGTPYPASECPILDPAGRVSP